MRRVIEHGTSGPLVVVLHGGPAAAGEAGPIAQGLAGGFRVLEPWQRGSGAEPLTVARHVTDLQELIQSRCPGERPALVGESWGAMLALAFAAGYPSSAGPLVLVGCGTFTREARARLQQTVRERAGSGPPGRIYDYDPDPPEPSPEDPGPLDMRAHSETWNDMLRLQGAGVYPAAFAAVRQPVLMLHGAYDPHPGAMIRDSLLPYLPRLEYREWERCGHSPWRERGVRREFFLVLSQWLGQRLPYPYGPGRDRM